MQIKLINVAAKGLDLATGVGVDSLTRRLQAIVPLQAWDYSFEEDFLSIVVPDGSFIPDLSAFGEVQNDGTTG